MKNLFDDYYNSRQLEIVEFAERVYHEGLRHTSINGSLYEDKLIKYLREDIPQLCFFKGQIVNNNKSSQQFDIIICKPNTKQNDFIQLVNPFVSTVERKNVLGVIELKKWGNPKMICLGGQIHQEYKKFKNEFSDLEYIFVCLRFKDRLNANLNKWKNLKNNLTMDSKFCFFGRTTKHNEEWKFPWKKNTKLLMDNLHYMNQYEELVHKVKSLYVVPVV